MNIFAPFARTTTNKALAPSQPASRVGFAPSATPVLGTAALNFFGRGSYDNNYANINRIADTIATVVPYAIDENGEKIEKAPQALSAVMRPNSRMGYTKFIKAVSVLALVYPSAPVLVWHYEGGKPVPGGKGATADNIAGFTFLEGYEIRQRGDKVEYIDTTTRQVFDDNDVIRVSFDVSPYAITEGYSASIAAKKWATLEDCLADYQVGHFKNGARPGGFFVISAPSTDDFNSAVDEMEKRLRGAGRNNQTVYVHRHVDMMTGDEGKSEVEWVPVSSNNNELALKDIFDQAERARDMAFGVPAELKGYLQNSNYSSVMMAERIYDKYVILPKLTQLWGDFTNELNRVTGGLGFAFQFDYDVQAIAEDEKTIAERKQVEYALYSQAVRDGNDPESVCEALNLPKGLAELVPKSGEQAEDEDGEKTEQTAEKSRKSQDFVRFSEKALTKQEQRTISEIEAAALAAIKADVEAYGDDSDEKRAERRKTLREVLEAVAVARMEESGAEQYGNALRLAMRVGIIADGKYTVSEKAKAEYSERLDGVVESFSSDTAESIERVEAQADTEGWSAEQKAAALAAIIAADAWRARRLANSEEHRAAEIAQLDAYEEAAEMIDREGLGAVQYFKTWNCMAGACQVCAALDGLRIPLEDSFPDIDDWGEDIAQAHPNCRCYLEFDIEDVAKAVKVDCPDCGLFLTEGTHAHLDKVKCNRCKKWYSIDINSGRSVAKEVKKA